MFVSSELYYPSKMNDIACVAVILHKLPVENLMESYVRGDVSGMSLLFENEESDLEVHHVSTDCTELRLS